MKIGIIGATGKSGDLILKEAQQRGHDVTAIIRNRSKLEQDVPVIEKNVSHLTKEDLSGFDVVVNSFGAPVDQRQPHIDVADVLINALQGTSTRLFVVGGAASLYVDEDKTTQVIDTPDFPDVIKPMAGGMAEALSKLQDAQHLNWTFLSPAVDFNYEGVRTGTYQEGKDLMITNADGNSYISYADYTIAVLDELENKNHLNERYTVVGEKQ